MSPWCEQPHHGFGGRSLSRCELRSIPTQLTLLGITYRPKELAQLQIKMVAGPRNHRQLTTGRLSFGRFAFLAFAAKSEDFDQVAIKKRLETAASVLRTQFYPID